MDETIKTAVRPRMRARARRYWRSVTVPKMAEQRLLGAVLLAVCAVVLWMCWSGATVEDQDATAVVLLAPLGLYMLFGRRIIIV